VIGVPTGSDGALQVAIVGAGPSGLFTAGALLASGAPVQITIFDRLPTPFGLVRYGVAPDHQNIKQITRLFDRTLQSKQVRFCGNVAIGTDVTIDALAAAYHAVILAYGAARNRKLGVPGEALERVYGADEFVGWYNGHPDYSACDFDLGHKTAVIIGHGNVAADICRMLLTPPNELAGTDITDQALACLRKSRIEDVYLVGRGLPEAAKFTVPELRALGRITDCATIVRPGDLPPSAEDEGVSDPTVLSVFRSFAAKPSTHGPKRLHFVFSRLPKAILGDRYVMGVRVQETARTGSTTETIECGAVFRSIGFSGIAMPGIPFDDRRGVILSSGGRVSGAHRDHGLYVAGWIKRGATGVIGTNRADSEETVNALLVDLPRLIALPKRGIVDLCVPAAATDYQTWLEIDAMEKMAGALKGKCRDKITSLDDVLTASARGANSL
jgi:ferredoxin/flavodoxin---NADP+ reductase